MASMGRRGGVANDQDGTQKWRVQRSGWGAAVTCSLLRIRHICGGVNCWGTAARCRQNSRNGAQGSEEDFEL